ncbi:MAG: SDR family oxidoreductase [Flavobacterium sp.]|nr:SDR family oxidoreductase [Pedobacter sp.]
MKILLTGANGYIGTRILPVLLQLKFEVVCMVRDKRRFNDEYDFGNTVKIITGDLLKRETLTDIPFDVDVAYYLVHSMSSNNQAFDELESQSARNFVQAIERTSCKQIIFLTGIVNDEKLSKHLTSRLDVENILKGSTIPCTTLRAAIIIGSGSASFEIIRDLVEKLPVMIAPKWVKTRCQPIAIRDVIGYLTSVIGLPHAMNRTFDIGGPDILTYREMLIQYAKTRKLNRWIVGVPFLTPKLSSLWLYFVTSVPYQLARSLVDSMINEVVCRNNDIQKLIPRNCLTYQEALNLAFEKIEQNSIVSSWKDALNRGYLETTFMDQIKVPQNGTMEYKVKMPYKGNTEDVLNNIWSIGGNRGWYYWDWIWELRGMLDKLVGGIGSRRGRTSNVEIKAGDALDFWRVLLADKANKRLLLYAEMKLPGEAWLEFKLLERNGKSSLSQVATFRPNGLWGRAYWFAMWPFHLFIFNGMAKRITQFKPA